MTGPAPIPRREGLLVAVLTLCWLAVTGWVRPLSLPDEGRYVGVAWEGLRQGDWLVPTLNGLPFFHKPPLFYWITEASMALFGANAWAARTAPLLGALLGALGLFALLRRWTSPPLACAALLALLAMPLFFAGAQFANLDMLVAGLITATIAAAADAALRLEHGLPHRRVLAAAFALAGLGVLAKGLIGFVLPGAVLLLWLALRGAWRTLRAMVWLPGLALMLVVCAPWFVAMQLRFPEFLHYFFVVQHVQRFAGGGFNNVQPAWFFPAVLLAATLPAVPWVVKGWRGALWRPAPGPGGLHWLLLCWFAVILVFFSIPSSKLVGYVLPTLPPLAGLIAVAWARVVEAAPRWRRWGAVSLAVGAIVGLGAVIAVGAGAGKSNRELARVLAAQRQPGEPVVMLESYLYDVPFSARLDPPSLVVEDWDDETLMARDSWRKELGDTRLFATGEAAAHRFQRWDTIVATLCAAPVNWVMGDAELAKTHPWLARATRVAERRHLALWRVRPADLDCGAAR